MSQTKKKKHTGNPGLFIVGGTIYLGLLILFGYQTWQFVDWLFPSDQMLMKLLTVLCFDVMALFWACVDLFYRFASRSAHTLVRWAWAISFILSLLASVFYLVIESMFRFQIPLNQQTVDIGYGITIGALTLNILFLTFWLYLEWSIRHPHEDEYLDDDKEETPVPAQQPVAQQSPDPVATPVSAPTPAPSQPTAAEIAARVMMLLKTQQEEKEQQAKSEPVQQAPTKQAYPILPNAPHYADTEPLVSSAQPSYIDDLVDSVGGESANPLASQNGHQK